MEARSVRVVLTQDKKSICLIKCNDERLTEMCRSLACSTTWTIDSYKKSSDLQRSLHQFQFFPDPRNSRQQEEWITWLSYLKKHGMAAIVNTKYCSLYIVAHDRDQECTYCIVHITAVHNSPRYSLCSQEFNQEPSTSGRGLENRQTSIRSSPSFKSTNLIKIDPSYLKILGQTHSAWTFGAIAEFVDNSRDAHASRLDISVDLLYFKKDEMKIPVLSIIDDGDGMTHSGILRMLSFGCKQAHGEDPNRLGRFGFGFKTGAMKIGRDALVLTQSSKSRSIAFLSQSYNETNDNIKIPVVSYSKIGRYMELDSTIQSEEHANINLSAIKEFSPFNEFLIGEQFGLFGKNGTGTQIFIWNLDKWGSEYNLEWVDEKGNANNDGQGDIRIRSGRIRSRPCQISCKVPLDNSLQSYLEVIFLNPRMKIFLQDSLVNTHLLVESLTRKTTMNGYVMARPIQLILGRSKVEFDRMNGGVFLYWNERLIEAYKRVGGMQHNGDFGRGVIGVVDVTTMMVNENDQNWVLSSKQGFQDCKEYAELEEWLARVFNEYWDEHFDNVNVVKGDGDYEHDGYWVECGFCSKWRRLPDNSKGFILPLNWVCSMEPYNGHCKNTPEQVEAGVVTVAARRYEHDTELLQGSGMEVRSSKKICRK